MSSKAAPKAVKILCGCFAFAVSASPLAAQDDAGVTPAPEGQAAANAADNPPQDEEREIINLTVTMPRGEVNPAQVQECEDRVDAGQISGEIVVCRAIGEDPRNLYSESREKAQKRYAEETKFAGSPPPPDMFGIPNHGNSIGFGSVPPPALMIDIEALPEAPPGSDADRIARGLAPRGGDEPTEAEIRERRRALGLSTPPISSEESAEPEGQR